MENKKQRANLEQMYQAIQAVKANNINRKNLLLLQLERLIRNSELSIYNAWLVQQIDKSCSAFLSKEEGSNE